MKIIKVGVVGSRSRNTPQDKQILKETLERQISKGMNLHLVSGGCSRGADRFAEELAKELGLEITIHYPDVYDGCKRWEYAKACFERNTLIAEECDILLTLWDGISNGTEDTMTKVVDRDKNVVLL